MQFSPYVLLRHPSYDLLRLNVFSVPSEEYTDVEDAMESRRNYFLSFIKSKDLLLSLPFSSKTVYQAIPHYEFHAAVKIRKKEKQTERALMKYLSRMSLNSSPLAAFAKSQFVDWNWIAAKPYKKYELSLSLIQRKEFFDLCYCDIGLQGFMRYRLNPSLQQHAQGFVYIHRNGEEESRVELDSDEQFKEMFTALKKKDFTFEQFVSQTDYDVNEFLEAQLIVPSYPIYSEHTIIEALIKNINDRHNLAFKSEDILGMYKDEFTDLEIIAQQKHWESQLIAFAKKLSVGLDHKLYSERMYYLNTYSKETIKNPSFDKEAVSEEVLRLVTIADQVSKNESFTPLNWDNVFEPQNKGKARLDLSLLSLKQKSDFEIELLLDSIAGTQKYSSFGIMLRFSEGNKARLINVSTPYGKFFAPALGLANDAVKSEISQWVNETAKDSCNLKDGSLHNKNRAHGFLPEWNNFGLDFQTPIEQRISLDFLDNGSLVNEETRQPLSAVNLGIEDYTSRSTMYQNLIRHSSSLPNLPVLVSAIQDKHSEKIDEHVSSSPKLITEHFILAYRKWSAVKSAFESFLGAKQIPLDQLNKWRKKYQMPRIVEYSIDKGKPFFLDFSNPWSVNSFLKLIKKMETNCAFDDLGLEEEINESRVYEAYYEVSL